MNSEIKELYCQIITENDTGHLCHKRIWKNNNHSKLNNLKEIENDIEKLYYLNISKYMNSKIPQDERIFNSILKYHNVEINVEIYY
jgi:hypothetical protein